MRKLALALTAAMAAVLVAVSMSTGSSHREAPNTALDPTADDTDVYAFTAKNAPGHLTVVANWIPLEDPAGGPNFFRFDDRARYYINVDNTGDGAYDIRYEFQFKTRVVNPGSFAYATPTRSEVGRRRNIGASRPTRKSMAVPPSFRPLGATRNTSRPRPSDDISPTAPVSQKSMWRRAAA